MLVVEDAGEKVDAWLVLPEERLCPWPCLPGLTCGTGGGMVVVWRTQPSSVTRERVDESWLTTAEIHPSSSFFAEEPDSDTSPARSASLAMGTEGLRLRSDFFALRLELLPDDRILSTISRVLELRGRDVGEPSVRKEGR